MITKSTVTYIANLAKINISEKELPELTQQMSDIISYVETLNELNLDNIEPTAHAVDTSNVFRDDVVVEKNIIKEVIKQAPQSEETFFKVPKVL